jgi:regulator of sigma E protease
MLTLVIFILILGLLVFVHEFGHFVVARRAGMKVHEFALGFPPRAFGWYKDPKTGKKHFTWGRGKDGLKSAVSGEEATEDYPDTLYTVNWLPLGGYVKIKGENGEHANDPDSFGNKKAWVRAVVLVAGVSMNFLLAAVLLGAGFIIGLPSDISTLEDKQAILVGSPSVAVQQVEKDSPADVAGITFGDQIVSINNVAIEESTQVSEYIAEHVAEELSILVLRGEQELTLQMTPALLDGMEDKARVGVLLVDAAVVRYPWYIAIYKGFVAAGVMTINILLAFFFLIKNLILGNGLAFDVAGPVGIAVIVGNSARLGISYLLNTIAVISLSLAVINILPIPALDGGRILFIGIEKLIKRPVPMKYEQMAHTIGFVLLMALIVVITWRDVVGLF